MLEENHHMHRRERRPTQLVELVKRRSCRFRHDRGRNIFDIPEHQTPKVYRFHLTLRIEIYVRQCSTFVLNCRVTWPPGRNRLSPYGGRVRNKTSFAPKRTSKIANSQDPPALPPRRTSLSSRSSPVRAPPPNV